MAFSSNLLRSHCRNAPLTWLSSDLVMLAYVLTIACTYMTPGILSAAAASVASTTVDPQFGIDFEFCGVKSPCQTIAYAVHVINASSITLAVGIFREPTVSIRNRSIVISGAVSATVFNCSNRSQTTGAAFDIANSNVTIKGVIFFQCISPNSNGGAVSASGSSVAILQCKFLNCSAASGGAIAVTGPGSGVFLLVQNSDFVGNSAMGGTSGCPVDAAQPCSTWGGAIAVFEMRNVTVSGCTMSCNTARATVPSASPQFLASRNAVAGGGCVSVLFFGSANDATIRVFGNRFIQCGVVVLSSDNANVGNGMAEPMRVYMTALVLLEC
jgi:hypothetical protein